jgi:fumarate reductase iron-sulfur subunit
MAETMGVDILRYRPEADAEPWLQRFEVPYEPDMSVLDALLYIKDELDGTLAFRWSCRMAICGSCGCMVNGVPRLGCKTFLRDYFPQRIRLEALEHFPIERDLIAGIDDFVAKLEEVKPYIIRTEQRALADGPFTQTPAAVDRFKQFSLCINCGLCYSACPQYGLNNEFMGPAALALLHRYNNDSRDQGRARRQPVVNAEAGVWSCTFVGYCSTVCPQAVDPAAAINQQKVFSLIDYARHVGGIADPPEELP